MLAKRCWNFFRIRSKRWDMSCAYEVGCRSCSTSGGRRNAEETDEIIEVSSLGGRVSSEESA